MGVKDLWAIISPTCQKKSLWELEGKTIAIDLSAWVCDSQFSGSISNTYLRNLFFRTSYLLLLGVHPVFVLEGTAPELKTKTIRCRLNKDKNNEDNKEKKVVRSRLASLQKQCVKLLSSMGISCVGAPGEAEAFCAHMNLQGMACGVVTQDSDVFLYGGQEVYRNFQLAPHYTCDVYTARTIEDKVGLTRTKMVALSLLMGSDYSPGIHGVGKDLALKFVRAVPDSQIFKRFQEWREESFFSPIEKQNYLTSDLQTELAVRQKAKKTEDFPNMEVVEEYMQDPNEIVIDYKWEQPNIAQFVAIAVKKLAWEEDYAVKKFLPLLTRWHLTHGGADCSIWLTSIVKPRMVRGKACYEVTWDSHTETTTEPKELVQNVYPEKFEAYEDSRKPKKTKGSKEPKSKKTKKEKSKKNELPECLPTLDNFVKKQPSSTMDDSIICVSDTEYEEDLNLSNIINTIVNRPNSNPAIEHYRKYNKIC